MIAKLGVLILTGFLLLGGCSQGGFSAKPDVDGYRGRNGAREARQDIQKGTLSLKTYGLPPDTNRYAQLLHQRLGVQLDAIADCTVTKDLLKYAKNYNTVVEAYIAKKYGPHALSDISEEVAREAESGR
jgi:hypothetical protein